MSLALKNSALQAAGFASAAPGLPGPAGRLNRLPALLHATESVQ